MRGVTFRGKAILLSFGIALGLSACAVYEPAPYYYSAPPAYGYYPPSGYAYYGAPVYAAPVVVRGGWWGGGHHWR
jgi:polyferredoxin